jgi:hypothetical protein
MEPNDDEIIFVPGPLARKQKAAAAAAAAAVQKHIIDLPIAAKSGRSPNSSSSSSPMDAQVLRTMPVITDKAIPPRPMVDPKRVIPPPIAVASLPLQSQPVLTPLMAQPMPQPMPQPISTLSSLSPQKMIQPMSPLPSITQPMGTKAFLPPPSLFIPDKVWTQQSHPPRNDANFSNLMKNFLMFESNGSVNTN